MKFPFEDFDENLVENADQQLSFQEKAIRTIVIGIAKVLIWKVKRARTYGDLYKIGKWFTNRLEGLEKKYGEGEFADNHEEGVEVMINEGQAILDDLEKEKDQESNTIFQ